MYHREQHISYCLIVIYSLIMLHMSIPHHHAYEGENEIFEACEHQDCDEHEDAFHVHHIPQHEPSQLQEVVKHMIFISLNQTAMDVEWSDEDTEAKSSESGIAMYIKDPPRIPDTCLKKTIFRGPPALV